MTEDMPKSRNATPISFLLRAQVREQMGDAGRHLGEIFDCVNILTIVERQLKGKRICIDASEVNSLMISYRVNVDPIKGLLQGLHGSKFIMTTGFCSVSFSFH